MTPKQRQRFARNVKKARNIYAQEQQYDWLSPLLDAYHITDVGTELELERLVKTTGRTLACKEGCSNCCLNPDVPINRIELMGLSFYATEVLEGEVRSTVKNQLIDHAQSTACPFLVNNRCTVYPVRPLACRGFHVYDTPCERDEDVSISRPHDVPPLPGIEVAWLTSKKLFPLFGFNDEKSQRKAFEDGYMFHNTRSMHTFDWSIIAKNMDQFDR